MKRVIFLKSITKLLCQRYLLKGNNGYIQFEICCIDQKNISKELKQIDFELGTKIDTDMRDYIID